VFADHIAKLPDLIVLCVMAIGLNGKRPTRPCVEINSMAAALTYQRKAQCAKQCLKIPEGDRLPPLKNLIEGFLTALHKARYYERAAGEQRSRVVQTRLFNLSSAIRLPRISHCPSLHFPASSRSRPMHHPGAP
jgi:hypothetical protein